MFASIPSLGILFALLSAVAWGSGDFTGGYTTRRASQYYVVAVSALVGTILVGIGALITGETLPSPQGMLFSALGGAFGVMGVAAFYRALSIGHNASIAPTAAVIGVSIPVIVSSALEGLPAPLKLLGFVAAVIGIWLVTSSNDASRILSREALILTLLAGLGFAGFLTFLGLVDPGKIYTPLVIARFVELAIGLILLWLSRTPLPPVRTSRLAVLVGVLDLLGNLFYILARQYTRLDVAVVLSSLYPASTVVLAGMILKEKITPRQWLGIAVCLLAIVLITI